MESRSPEHGPRESDPIFHAPEPTETTPRSTQLLWQFFLFPLVVVGAAVGLFVFFGWLAGRGAGPEDRLDQVLAGGENESRQASQQLGRMIAEARAQAESAYAADPAGARPEAFYERPGYRGRLREALVSSVATEGVSEERQVFLAHAVGVTAFPATDAEADAAVDALARVLYPADAERTVSSTVRVHAAMAVVETSTRLAEPLLLRMAADSDVQVREVAHWGLARFADPLTRGGTTDGPEVRPALRRGLGDASNGVRLQAAVALAVRGDASGRDVVVRALTREGLSELGIRPAMHADALVSVVQAAAALGDAELKERVERLAEDDRDEEVRRKARTALAHWRNG